MIIINKENIIEYLKDNHLDEVEEVSFKDEVFVCRFFYDFDEAELKSAAAYADDECSDESKSEAWFEEYYLPYLNELAIDTAGEILQEAMETFDVESQFVCYEADEENDEYCEFISVFYEKGKDVDIENILDELNI